MLMIAAPPMPWSTRAATRVGRLVDRAQASEPRVKTTMPTR